MPTIEAQNEPEGNMGYLICYTFHHICIPASQVDAALAAIDALYQPDTIARLGTGTTYDPSTRTSKKCYRGVDPPPAGGFVTLIDALQAWSLRAVPQPDGSIEIVEYGCDKAGDEDVLFDAIAPFLDYAHNPRVDAFQSNNQHWRHSFYNRQHRQVPGKVVYADQCPELFDPSEL